MRTENPCFNLKRIGVNSSSPVPVDNLRLRTGSLKVFTCCRFTIWNSSNLNLAMGWTRSRCCSSKPHGADHRQKSARFGAGLPRPSMKLNSSGLCLRWNRYGLRRWPGLGHQSSPLKSRKDAGGRAKTITPSIWHRLFHSWSVHFRESELSAPFQ